MSDLKRALEAETEVKRLRHVIKRLSGQIEFMAEEKRQTEADRADTVRRAFPQFLSAPEATP
jgi:hypothetical protein